MRNRFLVTRVFHCFVKDITREIQLRTKFYASLVLLCCHKKTNIYGDELLFIWKKHLLPTDSAKEHRRPHGRHPPVPTAAQHGLGAATHDRTDQHHTRTRSNKQLVREPHRGGESLGCRGARGSLCEKTGLRRSLNDKQVSSQRRGRGARALRPQGLRAEAGELWPRRPDLTGSSSANSSSFQPQGEATEGNWGPPPGCHRGVTG